jgi:hypothetical protein
MLMVLFFLYEVEKLCRKARKKSVWHRHFLLAFNCFGIGIPALPSYGHFAVCTKVLYFESPGLFIFKFGKI